ncbi:MAG TPA: hypothetical protein VGD62_07645 [Acidobacteriaceae bacterium]
MRLPALIPVIFALLLSADSSFAAGASNAQQQAIPGLGAASFPVSTRSPEAQTAFLRGLLLLHLFEYASAAESFQAAERLDPAFAMAYWGEAMTFNHPVWNQLDQAAGQEALARFAKTPAARAAHAADPRERRYLAAVEILYDPAGTKAARDARYAEAMRAVSAAYPEDDEARLFYSLALLGKCEGKRDVPTYLEAAALAQRVFKRNPAHPGAAHYWIHGMDDPEHASGALVAANALSRIAPDAGHAQHMCSHIFMALGMWDEVVEANEAAERVVSQQSRARGEPFVACFHYNVWLEYGYFQQGRRQKAEEMVAACQQTAGEAALAGGSEHAGYGSHAGHGMTPEAQKRAAAASLMEMRDMAVIESGAATDLAIDTAGQGDAAAWYFFANGYAAALRGEMEQAGAALEQLKAVEEAAPASGPRDPQQEAYLSVLQADLVGAIASREGHMEEATRQVRHAVAVYESQPFDFGPPAVVKPPEELLGELLIRAGDYAGAVQAFRASLRLAPNRTRSLVGMARAQKMAGDVAGSRATWGLVAKNWQAADPGLHGLAEARSTEARTHGTAAQALLDARLEDVDRPCREQGYGGERDHGLNHHDQLGPAGEHGDVCW